MDGRRTDGACGLRWNPLVGRCCSLLLLFPLIVYCWLLLAVWLYAGQGAPELMMSLSPPVDT